MKRDISHPPQEGRARERKTARERQRDRERSGPDVIFSKENKFWSPEGRRSAGVSQLYIKKKKKKRVALPLLSPSSHARPHNAHRNEGCCLFFPPSSFLSDKVTATAVSVCGSQSSPNRRSRLLFWGGWGWGEILPFYISCLLGLRTIDTNH